MAGQAFREIKFLSRSKMRSLKLVVWDLDQTILTGILEEGDKEKNPIAGRVIRQLDERGILQALATQNSPDIVPPALEKLGWRSLFIQVEADLGPKVKKLKRILDALEVHVLDTAFVDEDPFERDSIAAQMADITTWSIAAVSYTHLRAHETDSYLVCRLLL